MIFKTAYETLATNGFQYKPVEQAIQLAASNGQLGPLHGTNVRMVEGGDSVADAIPAFAHPMLVHRGAVQGHEPLIAVDVRPFGRYDKDQWKFVVKSPVYYKLALQRAQLTDIWVHQSPIILQNASPLPMALYAGWVSENVSKRYALDPNEQFKLSVYAAVFYLALFKDTSVLEDDEKTKTAAAVSRALRASGQQVLDVIDEIAANAKDYGNVTQFCTAARAISVRMAEFNPGVLYSILGGTWYGVDPREVVAVAIEHPPTWMAVLVAAFYERTYKHSGITKMLERKSHRNDGDVYVRAVLNLLSANTNP